MEQNAFHSQKLGCSVFGRGDMLKIGAIRWKGRCHKHPGYAPEIDGRGGIKGGCHRCELLLDIYMHHTALVRAIREFGTRPEPVKTGQAVLPDRQMSFLDPES
jgi:hypothetical protein